MKDNTFSDTMIALFVKIDDLVKAYRSTTAHSGHLYAIGSEQQGRRTCNLSGSEVAIILVCYHLSHYKTFKHYYEAMIMGIYRDYFPHAPGLSPLFNPPYQSHAGLAALGIIYL